MSKRVVFNPIFQHIQGKYSLKDEDGHATPITFKEMSASGRKTLQIGESRKRNLNQLPYSQKELDHQAKFKVAQANTSAALKDPSLKSAFADEFKAALTAGTTTATTLRGFTFTKYYADPAYVPTPAPAGSGTTGSGTNPSRQYTISVTSANTDQGTVTGGGTYSEGSRITLTATPKQGYAFDKWSDGATTATRNITVSQNLTLTATFKTATGGGTGGNGDEEEEFY